jgi:predicted  nucleic acid-binding Zn-ribbon protein
MRQIMVEPDSIFLVYLRRLPEQIEAIREDNREIKSRLGILEQQGASLSTRLDRIEVRLDRIERRMDLVEA